MATPTYNLSSTLQLTYQVSLQETTGNNVVNDNLVAGSGSFTKIQKALANGTASGQGTKSWHDNRTVASGANDDLCLNGNPAFTDAFGRTLSFTIVKWFLLRITVPATGQRLLLGNHPNAPVNLWMNTGTATTEVRELEFKTNQIDGWSVSPPISAPAQPTGSDAGGGGTIPAGSYYIVVTYLNAAGETVGSPVSAAVSIAANHQLTVPSPAAQTGATQWKAYVSAAGGNTGPYVLQGGAANIGTNQTFSSLATTGATPPTANTAYYQSYLRVNNAGSGSLTYDISVVGY